MRSIHPLSLGKSFERKEQIPELGAFSSVDMVATLSIPGVEQYTIGELEAISYQSYRETSPVRTSGHAAPRGFARGGRTVAGTLVFLIVYQHIIHRFIERLREEWEKGFDGQAPRFPRSLRMDAMPAFNITINAANEYGQTRVTTLKGVVVLTEGQVSRIDQITSDVEMKFLARDIEPWNRSSLSSRFVRR